MIFNRHMRIKKLYKQLFPGYERYLEKELQENDTVLDLGCGKNSPLRHCRVSYSVGIDLFEPYLKESKKKRIHNDYVLADVRNLPFAHKSFDVVACIDILEHLTKKEGYKLIKNVEQIAKKKIIILTPNGFLPQAQYDKNVLQIHKSGWTIDEFKRLGFDVKGINGLKFFRGEKGKPKFKFKLKILNLAVTVLLDLSQKIVSLFPQLAFQLLAVKKLKHEEC